MGYYYTRDHLGSVRELLNGSGAIVARYSYDPYGRTALVSGTNLATKQYAGYYAHQTSGLYLTKYRAYDPTTGRWSSRDPLDEKGGMNLYEYCGNNPIFAIDPLGLEDSAYQYARALAEMLRAYEEMEKANVIGADKYFHCLAPCRAARVSSPNKAMVFGYAREFSDITTGALLGEPYSKEEKRRLTLDEHGQDSIEDLKADAQGAFCPKNEDCKHRCAKYLVNGLDPNKF